MTLPVALPSGSVLVRGVFAAFATFALAVPLVRLGLIPVGSTFIQLADLVFLVTAVSWLLAVLRRELPIPPRVLLWCGILYFAAAAVSLTGSENLRSSMVKLVGIGYLVTIGLVTSSLAASSRTGFRFVLGAWAAGAIFTGAMGVLGVLLFYFGLRDRSVNVLLWGYGTVPTGGYPRVAVFFMNANMLCNYLLVSLGVLAMLYGEVEQRARRWLVAGAIAICVTILFTLSTGLGGLGLGGAVGWLLWHRAERRVKPLREGTLLVAGAGVAAVMALITVFLLVPRGTGDVRMGPIDLSFETSGRVSVWRSAANTFAKHPIHGAGVGTLVAETTHARALVTTEHWRPGMAKEVKAQRMESHNMWLSVAGQLGLLGLVPFVFLVVALTRSAIPRRGDDAATGRLKAAAIGTIVGAIVYHGFFGSFEDSRQYWFMFGVLAALSASARPLRSEARAPEASVPATVTAEADAS